MMPEIPSPLSLTISQYSIAVTATGDTKTDFFVVHVPILLRCCLLRELNEQLVLKSLNTHKVLSTTDPQQMVKQQKTLSY